jgi:tetratricopeptide (TPR) repeat protein
MVLACVAYASVAHAQGARSAGMSPEAKARLERGLRLFDTQEYAAAIAEFKAAYQIEAHPDFLYALAQAQRLSGNCRDAVNAYRSFLRAGPPEEEASLARENLGKCETILREEEAKPAPSPPVASSPPAPGPAPPAQPPQIAPAARSRPSSGDRSPFYTDALGDVLCGVGLVGLVLGGTFWGLAIDRAASADDGTFDDYEAAVDSAEELRAAAVIAAVAGAGFVTAGVIRFATRPDDRQPASVAASLAPGGVRLRATF